MGAYCSVSDGVQIFLGGEHRVDWVTTFPFNVLRKAAPHFKGHPHSKGDVIIGNDVWIGYEAVILSGVNIGDGAVISARSVVTRDVPAYAVVAGNPASVVKKRFSDGKIDLLLGIQWWNWDDERIEKSLPYLLSDDVDGFVNAVQIGRI